MIHYQSDVWYRATQLTQLEIKVVEELFSQLMSYVNSFDQLYPYEEGLRIARSALADQKTQRYLKTYYELENFIVTSRAPIVTENITTKVLRRELLEVIPRERLPLPFQIIFLEGTDQISAMYQLSAQNIYSFTQTYMYPQRAEKVLGRVFDKTLLIESISLKELTIAAFVSRLNDATDQDIFQIFRSLYWEFFVDIRHAFGDSTAIALFRYDYDFFRLAYGAELSKMYLDVLPEGVLEVERLTFLSREELEEEIRERTSELENFNEELEKRVSERTRELEEANRRLRELDKVKTEFISVAAHQFRTPMAAIKWTLSTVLESDAENLTAEQKMLLMQGQESTDRVIRLINQMLVVTRIESGRIQYEYIPLRIENLIDSVLRDFVGHSETVGVEIIFHKPDTALPYIQADSEKIHSVIQNLVENALQYTRRGGKIELSTELQEGFVKVFVKDNGIGIPEKQKSGIFNKFFRAENATKERADGSGLGLYIIKRIVESHGGLVGFDSEENVGTTFYFTLPIAAKQEAIAESEQRAENK